MLTTKTLHGESKFCSIRFEARHPPHARPLSQSCMVALRRERALFLVLTAGDLDLQYGQRCWCAHHPAHVPCQCEAASVVFRRREQGSMRDTTMMMWTPGGDSVDAREILETI